MIVVPPIIIGEVYYSMSRHQSYEDLSGFQSITFTTNDSLEIQGWYTNNTDNLVIIVHGHGDHSAIMHSRYDSLFDNYDRLYLDLRNHGRSDDMHPVTLGVNESIDVKSALEWVDKQSWNKTILFGTSMGAIASLLSVSNSKANLTGLITSAAISAPL